MSKTAIEWTDATWSPVTGCTPVSEGCEHCYARRMAHRLKAMGVAKYRNDFAVTCHPDTLDEPLHWRKPRRIFVGSMTDLFHEDVSDDFIGTVLMTAAKCTRHTFQILTKRPRRMAEYINGLEAHWREGGGFRVGDWPPPNLWLGVTAENQKWLDERWPFLAQTPAAVRFVSIEPMLGPVTVGPYLGHVHADALGLPYHGDDPWYRGIDWVICGAETGPGKRPMELGWVRNLRAQCRSAGVPFFFKRDSNGSRLLDGRKWEQYPETTP